MSVGVCISVHECVIACFPMCCAFFFMFRWVCLQGVSCGICELVLVHVRVYVCFIHMYVLYMCAFRCCFVCFAYN